MSLVERAVKRLGELDRLGTPNPTRDEAQSARDEAPSTIERAIGLTESTPASQATAPERLPILSPARQGSTAGVPEQGNLQDRREPTLSVDPAAATAASGLRPKPTRNTQSTARVDLDLRGLASAGFIDLGDPESPIANEFRKIKRPLIRACQGRLVVPVANANRIMVTSSVQGEGKSFIALNLALSVAMERDFSVLLVDADTTRRSLSKQLGIGGRTGLLDLLDGDSIQPESALLHTNVDRLELLPAGGLRPQATELLASDAMERVIEDLASRYRDRILIFDTPPLLGAPEPAVLATHMGQIIVVVEAGKTTRKVLGNALGTIESCPVVMTILNKTSGSDAGYHYYEAAQGEG